MPRKLGVNSMLDQEMFIGVQQLCRNTESSVYSLQPSRQDLAVQFLRQFTQAWKQGRHKWAGSDDRYTGSAGLKKPRQEAVVLQYHVRMVRCSTWLQPPDASRIIRDSGVIKRPYDKTCLYLVEDRYSVGLKTTWTLDLPIFSLITMADGLAGSRLKDLEPLWDTKMWAAAMIRPSIRATGVAAFAFRIHSLLLGWETHWSDLLDGISRLLDTKVS